MNALSQSSLMSLVDECEDYALQWNRTPLALGSTFDLGQHGYGGGRERRVLDNAALNTISLAAERLVAGMAMDPQVYALAAPLLSAMGYVPSSYSEETITIIAGAVGAQGIVTLSGPGTSYLIAHTDGLALRHQYVTYYSVASQLAAKYVGSTRWRGELGIARRIQESLANTRFEPEIAEAAGRAAQEAREYVSREQLDGEPLVMFSDDGVLTLQWRDADRGLVILFAGDGIGTYAIKVPGGQYATGGKDFDLAGELPHEVREGIRAVREGRR